MINCRYGKRVSLIYDRGLMRALSIEWIVSAYHVVCVFSHVWFFCDHLDHGLSGSSVHGIFQARILEWVAISYSQDPWDLLNPRIEPTFPAFFTMVDSLPLPSPGKPYKWMSLVGIQAYKGVLNAKWLMPAVRPMGRLSRGYSFWVVWLGESFKEKWGLIQTLKGG